MNILDLRLLINDPAGFIAIKEVLTLPTSPDEQTLYKVEDNKYLDKNGERIDLMLSDATLEALILKYGIKAQCRAYTLIRQQLGSKLSITKLTAGADSTEFTSLVEMYNYYKSLETDCKESVKSERGNNSGRMGQAKQPTIAGGML